MNKYKTFYKNGSGNKHNAYITINRENPGDTLYTVTPFGGTTHKIYYGENPKVEKFTRAGDYEVEDDMDFENYWFRVGKEARKNKNEDTRFVEALKKFGNFLLSTLTPENALKYQQGGQFPKEQQEELQYAVLGYIATTNQQPKNENELIQLVQALMQLKQREPEQYTQLVQLGMQKQAVKAKYGAKLDYVKKLKGKCPKGQELKQKGGKMVCMPCMKKKK